MADLTEDNAFELEYQLNSFGVVKDIIAHTYMKHAMEIKDIQTGKEILDIGGGPKSLLLNTFGFKRGVIVDPVNYVDYIPRLNDLFSTKNIEFRNCYVEDLHEEYNFFDEVWSYNCIVHTSTPEKYLEAMLHQVKDGGIIRICEPMHEPYIHHPTKVTKELMSIITDNSYEVIKQTVIDVKGEGLFAGDHMVIIAKIKKPKIPKLKIHIYGLPHTLTVRDDPRMMTCAYTTKVWLLCKKLMEEGHEVVHYGVEGSVVPCTENVEYIPYDMWEKEYGHRDAKSFHVHEGDSEIYRYAAAHLPDEINKRIKDPKKEVVLASFGFWAPELLNINEAALIEFGVGYDAVFSNYRAFESYAHMHTIYGLRKEHIMFKGWFDSVIPGYVDPTEFEFNATPEDYFLYIGRLIENKGVHVAAQLAKHCGFKLKVAGNGDSSWMFSDEYKDVIEYVGVVGVKEKKELLKNAKATFCTTHYVEPFANVHMESLMCGTPVIATDWGVYSETLPHGEVGFRVRTWEDYLYAIEHIGGIDRKHCREWAMSSWSLDAVYPKFEAYFNKCATHFNSNKQWYFEQGNYHSSISNYTKSYDDYVKVHLGMVLTNSHVEKGIQCINSYRKFHDNYDITIIDCNLTDENKKLLKALKGFKKFIVNDGYQIPFAKAIYMKDISDSGKILMLDADILFIKNIDDFLFFDVGNKFIHVVDDFATPLQQDTFNKKIDPNMETYFNAHYFTYFPDLLNYKNNITFNCGIIAMDMSNLKTKKFLLEWSDISKDLNSKIITWPFEQGVFNYMLFRNYINHVKSYNYVYNSSAYKDILLSTEDNSIKVIHYHTDAILNEYKKVYKCH